MANRIIIRVALTALTLLACQSTELVSQISVEPTSTTRPSRTLAATQTPLPTDTPRATGTPTRTATRTLVATRPPTAPPPPAFTPQTKKIGPIRNTSRDQEYTIQLTVSNVRYLTSDGYSKPKSGYVYLIVFILVQNAGPGTAYSMYTSDFQVKDANGAVRGDTVILAASDCRLDLVDLSAGGSIEGCIPYEVPASGRLEFIYAPYKYEGLQPGRYLSFIIRQ